MFLLRLCFEAYCRPRSSARPAAIDSPEKRLSLPALRSLPYPSLRGYAIVSLVIGAALLAPSASAQDKAAPLVNSDNKTTGKEVTFEVFSIRPRAEMPRSWNFGPTPNGYTSSLSMYQAIMLAYAHENLMLWQSGHGSTHVLNLPNWAGDWYDINARVADEDLAAWRSQSKDHELLRSALQAALRERCKLVVREQPTEVPFYDLVIRKSGLKLKPAAPGKEPPTGLKLPDGGVAVGNPQTKQFEYFHSATMEDLAWFLTGPGWSDHPVRDMTGLTGRYDFRLLQTDEPPTDGQVRVHTFLLDQLGLELKPAKGPGLDVVIEHIEKPDPN